MKTKILIWLVYFTHYADNHFWGQVILVILIRYAGKDLWREITSHLSQIDVDSRRIS